MRAILLARATAEPFRGRRSSNVSSQVLAVLLSGLAWRITAIAPTTSSCRSGAVARIALNHFNALTHIENAIGHQNCLVCFGFSVFSAPVARSYHLDRIYFDYKPLILLQKCVESNHRSVQQRAARAHLTQEQADERQMTDNRFRRQPALLAQIVAERLEYLLMRRQGWQRRRQRSCPPRGTPTATA